jgi:hypothetical protein
MARWTWEHVLLVWLLAMGAAVVSTLVRFPPGAPFRPVRVPPPAWRARIGPGWVTRVARRERALVLGWVVAPLAAACVTGAWAVARARGREAAR